MLKITKLMIILLLNLIWNPIVRGMKLKKKDFNVNSSI